jgi:hypothetical protein
MTDILLKPEDTGEIRRDDPGTTTTNLTFITQAPAFRRPDATGEIPRVIEGSALDALQGPQPKPRPIPQPPRPKVDDRPLADGEEVAWTATYVFRGPTPGYVGRRRRSYWYTPLVEAVAIAWDRILRAAK